MASLKDYVASIEHLEAQKEEFVEQISEVYREAKNDKFNTKVLKKIIALRKKEPNEVKEEQELLEFYQQQLGM